MHYTDYNEKILHRTGDLPMAYYYVDENHPRYQMRIHWHRETEILFVRKGSLLIHIDGVSYPMQAGEAVVLGEGAVHGAEPCDALYTCLVFDPYGLFGNLESTRALLRDLGRRTFYFNVEKMAAHPELCAALTRLFDYVDKDKTIKALGALYEIFGTLPECEDALLAAASHNGSRMEQIKPALEYMEQNYARRVTLQELSRLAGLSEKYFCRAFKEIIHRSPIEYLNHYRIECACGLLLSTDKSVAEIAQLCGFSDSSFFIKQFRKQKGTTPYKYRKDESQTEIELK